MIIDEGACDEAERRGLVERLKGKAVRERRAWLAEPAAAEPRETEEVKRTGPESPAPRLQGREKGEDDELSYYWETQ